MAKAKPWDEDWELTEELSKGGQGITFRAHRRAAPEQACVMKLLRNNRSAQARRRMAREVINLALVRQAGGQVPRVIDHNADTENVADTNVPLYLAMEFIEGETLRQLVTRRGSLPLPEALAIAKGICATVRIAHAENVLHRDLKPENVVVKPDGVGSLPFVLDYGISFNGQTDDAEGLTRTDEGLGNNFVILPEAYGTDQRDRRSDLTAIAALLFYSLTGKVPGALRDGSNRMPHQRHSELLATIEDDLTRHYVGTFFSKAFAVEFDLRFQTVDELAARISELEKPSSTATPEDPIAVAARAKELLHRHSRPTILAGFRKRAETILPSQNELTQGISNGLREHEVALVQTGTGGFSFVEGIEQLFVGPVVSLQLRHHRDQRGVQICVGASGDECIVYRAYYNGDGNKLRFVRSEELLRYPGSDNPPVELIIGDLRTQVARLIEELLRLAFDGEVPAG